MTDLPTFKGQRPEDFSKKSSKNWTFRKKLLDFSGSLLPQPLITLTLS